LPLAARYNYVAVRQAGIGQKESAAKYLQKGGFTLKADIPVQLVICTPPTRFSR
jgi:hypothetical protein